MFVLLLKRNKKPKQPKKAGINFVYSFIYLYIHFLLKSRKAQKNQL